MRHYLVVDDNRDFADNLAEIIRDEGAEVTVADGGRQALEQVRAHRFDALLTDMRMPTMGGAALVHEIRQEDPGLPAIVMTAYTQDDELASARAEGLLAVLPKPVPLELLLQLLAAARRRGLVALVEDDVALSDNLSEVLRTQGFAAVTASSVLEAERLGPVRPFAALVDLRVPGGPDGEAMRKLAVRFPGLPMLVVTGHPSGLPPLPNEGVFIKPFDTGELLRALERLHRSAEVRP